ncbi:hypothetical protein Bbelb_209210 [Branchiostoma belcheri]|nr:hypothetical protein Bbelb_209210 [Branchiostoma belcheri]
MIRPCCGVPGGPYFSLNCAELCTLSPGAEKDAPRPVSSAPGVLTSRDASGQMAEESARGRRTWSARLAHLVRPKTSIRQRHVQARAFLASYSARAELVYKFLLFFYCNTT